jgi:hypothetical protein
MSIAVRTEREGDRARLVPVGTFDVAHAPAVAEAARGFRPIWKSADRSIWI